MYEPRTDTAGVAGWQHGWRESPRDVKRQRMTPPRAPPARTARIQIDLAGAQAYMATEHARTNVAKKHIDDPYKQRFVGKTDAHILGEYIMHHRPSKNLHLTTLWLNSDEASTHIYRASTLITHSFRTICVCIPAGAFTKLVIILSTFYLDCTTQCIRSSAPWFKKHSENWGGRFDVRCFVFRL